MHVNDMILFNHNFSTMHVIQHRLRWEHMIDKYMRNWKVYVVYMKGPD
jgi:hypothetical protein